MILALAIFLGASLLSYDPADPPSTLVYPERQQTANLCGRSGSVASALLLSGLGLGAYYLLASLAVLDVVLLARREVHAPWLRLVGWILSLVGFCTLAGTAFPRWSPGPATGSGGYLGATGRGILEEYFAATGSYIVVASLIVGGLLLCTDYALVKALAWAVGFPVTSLGRGAVRVGKAYAGRTGLRRSDLEPSAGERDDFAVRVVRRQGDSAGDGKETSGQTGPGDESAAEPAAAAAPASEPRVRKPKKSQRASGPCGGRRGRS